MATCTSSSGAADTLPGALNRLHVSEESLSACAAVRRDIATATDSTAKDSDSSAESEVSSCSDRDLNGNDDGDGDGDDDDDDDDADVDAELDTDSDATGSDSDSESGVALSSHTRRAPPPGVPTLTLSQTDSATAHVIPGKPAVAATAAAQEAEAADQASATTSPAANASSDSKTTTMKQSQLRQLRNTHSANLMMQAAASAAQRRSTRGKQGSAIESRTTRRDLASLLGPPRWSSAVNLYQGVDLQYRSGSSSPADASGENEVRRHSRFMLHAQGSLKEFSRYLQSRQPQQSAQDAPPSGLASNVADEHSRAQHTVGHQQQCAPKTTPTAEKQQPTAAGGPPPPHSRHPADRATGGSPPPDREEDLPSPTPRAQAAAVMRRQSQKMRTRHKLSREKRLSVTLSHASLERSHSLTDLSGSFAELDLSGSIGSSASFELDGLSQHQLSELSDEEAPLATSTGDETDDGLAQWRERARERHSIMPGSRRNTHLWVAPVTSTRPQSKPTVSVAPPVSASTPALHTPSAHSAASADRSPEQPRTSSSAPSFSRSRTAHAAHPQQREESSKHPRSKALRGAGAAGTTIPGPSLAALSLSSLLGSSHSSSSLASSDSTSSLGTFSADLSSDHSAPSLSSSSSTQGGQSAVSFRFEEMVAVEVPTTTSTATTAALTSRQPGSGGGGTDRIGGPLPVTFQRPAGGDDLARTHSPRVRIEASQLARSCDGTPELARRRSAGSTALPERDHATNTNVIEQVVAGTAVSLVTALTDEYTDAGFTEELLFTYRYLMTPMRLLRLLRDRFRFRVPHKCSEERANAYETWRPVVRLRVVNVLRKWVRYHFYDFESYNPAEALDVRLVCARLCGLDASPGSPPVSPPGSPASSPRGDDIDPSTSLDPIDADENVDHGGRALLHKLYKFLDEIEAAGLGNHARELRELIQRTKWLRSLGRGNIANHHQEFFAELAFALSNRFLASTAKLPGKKGKKQSFITGEQFSTWVRRTLNISTNSQVISLIPGLSPKYFSIRGKDGSTAVSLDPSSADWNNIRFKLTKDGKNEFASRGSIPKSLGTRGPVRRFVDIHPLEVARQLTLLEHDMFVRITPRELLHKQWAADEADQLSAFVLALIERFNTVSFWVATELMSAPVAKDRVTLLKRFIAIAQYCRAVGNYNSMMEIVVGLSLGPISRLKQLWKSLPTKYTRMLEQLMELASSQSNYASYRAELKVHPLPVLPYFGVFLKDLTFIEDGNPKYFDKDHHVYNFERMRMASTIFSSLQHFQSKSFLFHPDEHLLRFLSEKIVVVRTEDTLWDLSYGLEKRSRAQSFSVPQ